MQQQIYPDMSRKERKKVMASAAYKTEYETYQATLPSDELSAEQDAYTRRAIELAKIKEEFTAFKKKKTAEIKAIEEEMQIGLQVINTGKREIEGNVYLFQDLQKNDMNYFDVNGMWVRSRKIRPEERQTTMAIGTSDVPVSDEELDEQDIEDTTAVDVTGDTLGAVDMPSEYAGMQADVMQDAPAHTVDDAPGTDIELEIDSIDAAGNEDYKAVTNDKQQEAEQKLAAHISNKKRLTKKQKQNIENAINAGNDGEIAATSSGDIDAENNPASEEDEFKLPE